MYELKQRNEKIAIDNISADKRSLNQNACSQINPQKWVFPVGYPIVCAKGDIIIQSYKYLIHDYGVPKHMNFDGANDKIDKNTLLLRSINKFGSNYHVFLPRSPR